MSAGIANRRMAALPFVPSSWLRRLAPVLGLLVLAPWVGEYLLGNVPADQLPALPFLMPLYGGGALLIREVTRRAGRGWPTILLLGLAYGIIEAGLVDQSLFNPSFEGHEFQQVTPIPLLGISASNTIAFVVGHAVWSIGIPIGIVELLTAKRRTTPWLGRGGFVLTVLLYIFGCAIIHRELRASEQFLASPEQLVGAGIAALVLIVGALVVPRRAAPRGTRWVPRPLLLGIGAFIAAGAFVSRPETWLGGVALALLGIAVAAALLAHWSRQRAWDIQHQFALIAGALPIYAWCGFVLTYLLRPGSTIAWIGNVVFALLAIGLLIMIGLRLRRVDTAASPDSR